MKYSITTIGCQMNKSDSERIRSYLNNLSYRESDEKTGLDLAIFVTCGIRQSAEDRIYGLVPRTRKLNPRAKIILTGCLSHRTDVRKRLNKQVDHWLDINNLCKLAKLLGHNTTEKCQSYLEINPNYNSKFSAFIPIGNGCDNFCSYCVVPYARGRENYRPIKNILNEVKTLLSNNFKEITLIAQNVNSYKSTLDENFEIYGKKIIKGEYDFSDLLKIIASFPEKFWLRFATSHPKDMSDKLIQTIARNPKICRHIHLPAQSGDNEILSSMNRKYSREHYLALIEKIRSSMNTDPSKPPVSITTDIIVGYPGETKGQFQNTVRLFNKVGYDMAYIAQYSPRPGTKATKLYDNISKDEKMYREKLLMKIIREINCNNNSWYQDKVIEVLVESINKKGQLIARTETGKTVKIEDSNNRNLIGSFVQAKITKIHDLGLEGKLMN